MGAVEYEDGLDRRCFKPSKSIEKGSNSWVRAALRCLVLVLPNSEVDGQAQWTASVSVTLSREFDKGFPLRSRELGIKAAEISISIPLLKPSALSKESVNTL